MERDDDDDGKRDRCEKRSRIESEREKRAPLLLCTRVVTHHLNYA